MRRASEANKLKRRLWKSTTFTGNLSVKSFQPRVPHTANDRIFSIRPFFRSSNGRRKAKTCPSIK